VIQTPRTYEELKDIKDKVVQQLQASGVLTNIQSTLELDGQDFVIDIDRDRAASLGIDVAAISETVDILVSGRRFTRFKRDGKEYDVRVEVDDHLRRSPQDIENIFVRSESTRRDAPQEMIPLSDLVNIRSRSAPIQLAHFNQMRSVSISGNLPNNVRLGEVVSSIKQITKETLPDGVKIDFSGETRRFVQEMNSVYLIFGLALAFIYLVMAAQFESFVDPFIIMLSVPLSMTGGLIMLWLAGGSFNVFSQIGLVTLIGLITKHGILIVDFANTLIEEGKKREDAIVEACRLRLRPILMTTFAMVLGSVPLAIATGAGAELRQQIGWVIVGGMSFGTLFTLFVVPTVYLYLAKTRSRPRHIKKALEA
jgi:multidrug efflux pump